MGTLFVGFDSAWTRSHRGAMVGVLRNEDGTYQELDPPRPFSFAEAAQEIRRWQVAFSPSRTIVLLDQPTVVPNATGQRPVENIVASLVSLRYGGVQPANTSRLEMFGPGAPVWDFLAELDSEQNPFARDRTVRVLETYPVLAIIAFGWLLPDECRQAGRLPKYNPERRKTFRLTDWQYVCGRLAETLAAHRLPGLSEWMEAARQEEKPRKTRQDCVDACLCLLVALHMVEGKDTLLIGQPSSGYIVIPSSPDLCRELETRCGAIERVPAEWVRAFSL